MNRHDLLLYLAIGVVGTASFVLSAHLAARLSSR